MPLSVYSAHVVLLEITRSQIVGNPMEESATTDEQTLEFVIHALTFVLLPLLWKAFVSARGPLEGGIAGIIRVASPGPKRPASDRPGKG